MSPTTAGSSCYKSPLAAAVFCQLYVPLLQVLTDLLNPEATHLLIREDVKKGIFVENLSSHVVHNSRPSCPPSLRPRRVFPWHSAPAGLLNGCGRTKSTAARLATKEADPFVSAPTLQWARWRRCWSRGS